MTDLEPGTVQSSPERTFRLAIVGCGGVARHLHAPSYASHPDRVQVAAACDPLLEQAQQLALDIPGCRPFSSLDEAIKQADWEIGVICSPTPVRVEIVERLARAGKHVFVEKPMADSLDNARKMVSAAERAGVKLAVHQNFRYAYPFDLARSLITEGRIGHPVAVLHRELVLRHDSGWRNSLPRYALSVMGIHWFDGFRWMLGQEPLEISCHSRSSPLSDAIGETDALVQATFDGATTVSYMESFSYPAPPELETIVIGESGSLRLRQQHIEEWRSADQERSSILTDHHYRPGATMPEATFLSIDQLLQAIEQDTSPSNSGDDNLGSMASLEAAYQSAERGEPVKLSSL